MSTFLWVIYPYICLAIFVGGHAWRFRYDKFGWTTRSSQLYESRLLRIGGPLFHFGILGAALGHVMGLVIPKSWTDAMGISQETYHLVAVGGGVVSGVAAMVGLAILIYRRRTTHSVFQATTWNDKVMYLLLGAVMLLGMWNTLSTTFGSHYNYRTGVAMWFRRVFWLQPDPALMVEAPFQFQAHAILAFLLLAFWPFTRLVHVFSAPLGYLTRPYIVYRTRDDKRALGSRATQRGWDRVGTAKK